MLGIVDIADNMYITLIATCSQQIFGERLIIPLSGDSI
jgi:hypothetical protein